MLLLLDATLTMDDRTKKLVSKKPALCAFLEHCCIARHYSFQVKKCGIPTCHICKPVRMNADQLCTTFLIRYQIPMNTTSVSQMYMVKKNTEEYRPSLQATRKNSKQSLGFTPCQQHALNVGLLVQCEECDMWRLLFAKDKLNYPEMEIFSMMYVRCLLFRPRTAWTFENCLRTRSQVQGSYRETILLL